MTDIMERPQTVDPDTDTDEPRVHHLVVSGDDKVTEAYVLGTAVTAICGARFVPSRDPDGLPLCQACKWIRDQLTGRGWAWWA